jgi:hypothetical protein
MEVIGVVEGAVKVGGEKTADGCFAGAGYAHNDVGGGIAVQSILLRKNLTQRRKGAEGAKIAAQRENGALDFYHGLIMS